VHPFCFVNRLAGILVNGYEIILSSGHIRRIRICHGEQAYKDFMDAQELTLVQSTVLVAIGPEKEPMCKRYCSL
jgi:hypothetical protein